MTPPYYKATVTGITGGWSYTSTQVAAPTVTKLTAAQIAALPDVQLADGLAFSWGFASSQVPAALDPCTATVRLAAKDATKLPRLEKGDLIAIDLRVSTLGSRIIAPAPMRVTEVTAELSSHPVYAALATVQLVELRADLANLTVYQGAKNVNSAASNTAHYRWRPRLAELAIQSGWSLACPSWWADAEDLQQNNYSGGAGGNTFNGLADLPGVASGLDVAGAALFYYDRTVAKCIDELMASHHPLWMPHSAYTGWQVGYPASWVAVRPINQWGYTTTSPSGTVGSVADPASTAKVFLMPASRRADGAGGGLPLVFAVRSGTLTLQPQYVNQVSGTSGHARVAFDAAWLDLPAKARKSRDQAPNQINYSGRETYQKASTDIPQTNRDSFRTYGDPVAQVTDGVVQREIDTQLWLGTAADDYHPTTQRFSPAETGSVLNLSYLVDASARAAWVYDSFTLLASRVPDDLASSVLSRIAPRAPSETDSDSHLLRHVTIYRPAAGVRVTDGLISGFIARGSLLTKDGDVVFTLDLTPGQPVWLAGTAVAAPPPPITVAQVDAATYQAQPASTIDPLIRVADLTAVAA